MYLDKIIRSNCNTLFEISTGLKLTVFENVSANTVVRYYPAWTLYGHSVILEDQDMGL